MLNECGENIPRFVSHYLDELPPVGFGSMDASALLSRLEQLNREVSSLKRAMDAQTSVSENLGVATAAMDRRISAMEKYRGPSGLDPGTGASREGEVQGPGSTRQEEMLDGAAMSLLPRTQSRSPQWSTVVKEGRRLKPVPQNVAVQPKPRVIQAHLKREQKKTGIIGTGTESNIQVVKTKLVSVFASRFSPNLDADTLRNYLTEKLGNKSVTCRKIDSTRNRFSSFQVTAECNEVADMYDPQLWPAGTYVRRYYEARRLRVNDSEACGSVGGVGLQRSVNTSVSQHGSYSLVCAQSNVSSQ